MGRLVIAIVLATVLVACGADAGTGSSDPDDPGGDAVRPVSTLVIRSDGGRHVLAVEVADTDAERQRGLMGRERLAPYDGMAFVWEDEIETGFWMKDTLIPLTIAFWDDRGRIIEILDMEPCTTDACPTYGPDQPFLGAVEVAQGHLDELGVGVGDLVELVRPAP